MRQDGSRKVIGKGGKLIKTGIRVPAKPFSGIVDFDSNKTEGIENSQTSLVPATPVTFFMQ